MLHLRYNSNPDCNVRDLHNNSQTRYRRVDAQRPLPRRRLFRIRSESAFTYRQITIKAVNLLTFIKFDFARDTFRAVHYGKRNLPVFNPSVDYAFAFDIDGVLMLGSHAIPAGARALKRLQENKIPYILLTNGGGKWELDRVAELSDRLGVNVPLHFKPGVLNDRFR